MVKVKFQQGEIIIPLNCLGGPAPDIDPSAVQNRLSQEDFMNCWERIKAHVACNLIIHKFWFVMLLLFVFGFFGYCFATRESLQGGIALVFVGGMIGSVILFLVNFCQMRKKLIQLFERENNEIWNSRGLCWKYVVHTVRRSGGKHANEFFLKLKVLDSAMDYSAPGQFQGTIPNPYTQQQVNYSPQMELRKYSYYFL